MNQKPRIVLSTIIMVNHLPLALLYLRNFVLSDRFLKKRAKITIKEFDWGQNDHFMLSEILKDNPSIVGFSCYVWNIKTILSLSSKIKKINKDIKVILGGPEVSPIAEDILEKNNQIDFIVRGEGEITFRELIKSLLNSNKNLESVSGITFRQNGGIINNPNRESIPNLDSIPSPYASNLKYLKGKEVPIETQRGCRHKCDFCYYHKAFDRIRYFSLGRVKKDLSFLLKQKTKNIYLMDPDFNSDIKRAKEICKFIIENNKNNTHFHTELRAELIDKELAELLYKANIKKLEIGLQSINKSALKSVNRRLNFQRFKNGIKLLKEYDFDIEIQLIFGLPNDTLSTVRKSIERILTLEPNHLFIFTLQVLPGTEIWNKAKDLGIVFENEPPHAFLKSKTISFEETTKFEKLRRSFLLLRNLRIIKCLCKDLNMKLLNLIDSWIDWVGEDHFLMNSRPQEEFKKKLTNFMFYLFKKYRNKINHDFYTSLLKKELGVRV